MDEAKRRSFVERVVAAGASAGVEVRPHPMSETTASAADAAAALGVHVGQIVKSLIFATTEEPPRGVLCLLSGADRADLAALAAAAGVSPLRRASAEEARAFTGYVIGGIPPFGHATSLIAIADVGLRAWEQLWAACGTHLDVFPISPVDLLRATGAREAHVAEMRDSTGQRREAKG